MNIRGEGDEKNLNIKEEGDGKNLNRRSRRRKELNQKEKEIERACIEGEGENLNRKRRRSK